MEQKIKKIFILFITIFLSIEFQHNIDANETSKKIKKFKKGEKFVIALIPEKNVFEQRRRYKYITEYLSKELNLDVKAEILPSYGDICDAFVANKVDAGFFGSFSYVLTSAKTHIIPVARPINLDGTSTYSGYLFVRRDSRIKTIEDMKDKVLVLVSRATTAGYIFPLDYFLKQGVQSMEKYFSRVYFAGSHDAAAWSVYIGEADVGCAKNHIFNALCAEYPDFKKNMVILAESLQVPSNALSVRGDLDPELIKQLKSLLIGLDKSKEGKELLKKFGALEFIDTVDKDYQPLYEMTERLGIKLETYPYKDE